MLYGVGGSITDTRRTVDDSVEGLAQMAAVGLGLPPETFTDAGKYGYEYSYWQFPRSHKGLALTSWHLQPRIS